ncbi:helix-turn-helix domain-containing protein [Aliamphritea hakodatensis]|uniref:helix-turn-helix domain-containing protein n=1 Tax=Aliamphritea hakodatensis TaxID=2895352 RepID=UPI0022FD825B|nr:helix-turn-helix domain-containing protein [Aliamphritea hakodatensis]
MNQATTNLLNNIAELAKLINSGTSYEEALNRIVYAVCRHTSWSMSSVLSMDSKQSKVFARARFDPYIDTEDKIPNEWPLVSSPTTEVIKNNKPLVISNMQECAQYPAHQSDAIRRNYFSVVILPLNTEDQHGNPMVLTVLSRQIINVDEDELSYLTTIGNLAAITVKRMIYLQRETARTERLQSSITHSAALMDLALTDSSIPHILEAVEKLLQHPVILVDLTQQTVIPGSPPAQGIIGDNQWQHLVSNQHARSVLQQVQAAEQATNPALLALELSTSGTLKYQIELLRVDDNVVGALLLLRQGIQETPILNLMTEQSEFALRVLMMRSFIHFKSETGSLNDLFQQLISRNWRNPEELIARAQHKGIRLDQSNYLLAIAPPELGNRTSPEDFLSSKHQQVASQVNSVFEASVCLIFEDLYLVSIPASQCSTRDKLNLRMLNLEKKLQWIFSQQPTLVSCQSCHQLDDYSNAWSECKRLIQLSQQFNRTGVLNEDSFGAYAILFAATNQSVVSNFINQSLEQIDQYDRKHKNKLLDTLSAFLHSNCRYQACADTLEIHVTTLRYRIERIEELFDINFEDADQRFGLELALRLRHMAGSGTN